MTAGTFASLRAIKDESASELMRVLVEEYDQLERSAQETAKPRGLLKLSAPISFGQQLGPTLKHSIRRSRTSGRFWALSESRTRRSSASRNSPSVPKLASRLWTELAFNSNSFSLKINICERLNLD